MLAAVLLAPSQGEDNGHTVNFTVDLRAILVRRPQKTILTIGILLTLTPDKRNIEHPYTVHFEGLSVGFPLLDPTGSG